MRESLGFRSFVGRLAGWVLGAAPFVLACHSGVSIRPPTADQLQVDGVYVAHNLGCGRGCDEVRRGDVITKVDGRPVATRSALLAGGLVADRPIALEVLRPGDELPRTVTWQGRPTKLPPLEDVPPLLTVGAQNLDRAEPWARGPLFSHAMPAMSLIHVDGGWVTGRSLYGRRSLLVLWPDVPLHDRRYPSRLNYRRPMEVFYGVLQKAEEDLERHGVSVLFVVGGDGNDTTVRRELALMSQRAEDGSPYPMLPTYRMPPAGQVQAFGYAPAREVGLQGSATQWWPYLRGCPAIVIVDEGGIVRWHSSGYHGGPLRTILKAVMFAMNGLRDAEPSPVQLAQGERPPGESGDERLDDNPDESAGEGPAESPDANLAESAGESPADR